MRPTQEYLIIQEVQHYNGRIMNDYQKCIVAGLSIYQVKQKFEKLKNELILENAFQYEIGRAMSFVMRDGKKYRTIDSFAY